LAENDQNLDNKDADKDLAIFCRRSMVKYLQIGYSCKKISNYLEFKYYVPKS